MEEKIVTKISITDVLLIIALIVIAVMGVFMFKLYKDKINTTKEIASLNDQIAIFQKNENSKNDIQTSKMTKDEALKIATDTYKNAYNKINEKTFEDMNGETYTLQNKQGKYRKVNLKNMKEYFSENAINRFKEFFVESNGEYYHKTDTSFWGSLTQATTLLGITNQAIRPLTVVGYSENMIVATGSIKDNPEIEFDSIDTDPYPLHIIFIKENNKWVIEFLEGIDNIVDVY